MENKNMAYWKAKNSDTYAALPGIVREGSDNMPDGKSKSSPFQASTYRAPQGNQALIKGHRQTAKTTGASVFSQILHKKSDEFKETKDMVKEKVVDAALSYAKAGSDKRLKHDINLIGKSPSGLNIYSFKYKDTSWGEGTYQGVMSDEIPQDAVVKHESGYDTVDYSKIDVDFIKLN